MEEDPAAMPPADPAAAPPVDPAADPAAAAAPAPPAPEEEVTDTQRIEDIQLALECLGISPDELEIPEKAVFANAITPENAAQIRKQLITIVQYHKATETEDV
jgi:hypothetical protein